MRILTYRHLDPTPVQASYDRVVQALSNGDLRSPNVKKLVGHPYYRAKLSDTHRLLLSFHRYQGETVCLLLDVILNHQYQKSRFLRGAVIREEQIEAGPVLDDVKPGAELRYLHPSNPSFHLLGKPMSFDDAQDAVYHLPLPLVLVGSAGSGKTALTLERLRALPGKSAYVTLSPYLARQAERLYLTGGTGTPGQRTAFLSLSEIVESLGVPRGQEVNFTHFRAWFARHQASHRQIDPHTLYEEIRGVLTGAPTGPLTLEAYLALGVRQSLYPQAERPDIYALFLKYGAWLNTDHLHDPNLAAFARLPLARPIYDALVVDEVQDVTPVQLALLTRLLKDPSQLLISGDANQVVHPNFFSWAAVRALFRDVQMPDGARHQDVSVLSANYRNAREITRVANRLLALRVARFGSIDRESSVPAETRTDRPGRIETLSADPAVLEKLNEAVRRNVDFAVIVLRDEDKAGAAAVFKTPLIFSAQEAKGLEYGGVILYGLISGQKQTYAEIAGELRPEDLDGETRFSRAGDKSDKSGEHYKFYLNALYVALTRGVSEVIVVEQDTGHPLLRLLGLSDAGGQVHVETRTSSARDWAEEARKLQAQGKSEQANAIVQDVLAYKPVPWEVLDEERYKKLQRVAIYEDSREKDRRAFVEYNVWHTQLFPLQLMLGNYEPAKRLTRDIETRLNAHLALRTQILADYSKRNFKGVLWETDLYGVDFRTKLNATPLMLAAAAGNLALVDELLSRGADPELTDQFGQTALMYALGREIFEHEFATENFPAIYDRLAPAFIDVHVDRRSWRLTRGEPEYGVLLRMLSCMKMMLYSEDSSEKRTGFPAADLSLGALRPGTPEDLNLSEEEIGDVLEFGHMGLNVDGGPAARLWVRQTHTSAEKATYMPNPDLLLRARRGDDSAWVPIAEAAGWGNMTLPETFEYRELAAVLAFAPKRTPGGALPRVKTGPGASFGLVIDQLYVMTGAVTQVLMALLEQPEAVGPLDLRPEFVGLEAYLERAFEALAAVRLAIPDDQGRFSALLDDGQQVRVSGGLATLSDAALRVLISWQAWRDLDVNTEVLQELRDHGFAEMAEKLLHSSGEQALSRVLSRRSPHYPGSHSGPSEAASLLDASKEPRGAGISEQTKKMDEAKLAGPLATFDMPAELLQAAIDKLQEAVDRDDKSGAAISVGFNTSGQSVQFTLISGMQTVFAEISGPSTPSGVAVPFTEEQQTLLRKHLWTGPYMEDDFELEDGLKIEDDRGYTFARNFALNAHRVKAIVRHSVGLALSVFPHDGKPLALKVLL